MHDCFHNAFYDSLPSLGKMLDGYAEEQGQKSKILELIVRAIVWEPLLLP
ncbi:MAG: hypothetical protein ACR5KX_03390 [Wolbachia sp.]